MRVFSKGESWCRFEGDDGDIQEADVESTEFGYHSESGYRRQ